MKRQFRWHDAELAATSLRRRESDRSVLLLLARLPFLYARVVQQLAGLRGRASIYRSLSRLEEAGLLGAIRPTLRPDRTSRLYYLTDLGIATVAADQSRDPRDLAHRNRIRGRDLQALLPGLPQLMAVYELLGALAASRPGRPDLLAWERPWRRHYQRPTAKSSVAVALPAYAALAWESAAGAYLLLPDLGGVPLRAYRAALDHLLVLRNLQGADFPALLVATRERGRAAAWEELIEEVRRARREAPLAVCVATWDEPGAGPEALADLGGMQLPPIDRLIQPLHARPLGTRHPGGVLPELVGDSLMTPTPISATHSLSRVALELGPADRARLDLVGRHPFLPLARLAELHGWEPSWARERCNCLIARGMMRCLEASEIGANAAALELVELTVDGLAVVAAQHGLSLGAAVRHLGLAGGGPGQPIGARRKLLASLAHTLGADAIFVGLASTARRLAAIGINDALVEWRNAAACSRGHLRPDGYGLYRHVGQLYGFFLEYDRGTMSARDYLAKFAAYYEYLASGRFERDYRGFPTVLVVTSDNTAEERVARAVCAAAVGRGQALPLLLTCEWRLTDPRNPYGILGPVWREPDAAFHDRRFWPLTPASHLPTPTGPRDIQARADPTPPIGTNASPCGLLKKGGAPGVVGRVPGLAGAGALCPAPPGRSHRPRAIASSGT